ncbi:helix-turn-helix transcriptional regulator [Rivularia sp. UHCC 0363]|uniref:helix-turn-helix transcriptional regulator n=1 Tax=Rivularia sp. UHCC 0363 TaxID=3110244 RepID=UPI002B20C263|nr:helix-turn-helix transcriptional regulator [Rivularia sp. UHCC 0363]MEA5596790.1 helix-turn-helix transcriptional regulator [Rivularia sp. UHCC 0363]
MASKIENQTDFTDKLLELMQQQNISSFKALSKVAGVSKYQIQRLRRGKIQQMRLEYAIKLSRSLQIELNDLINNFSETELTKQASTQQSSSQIADLKKEYERLQKQLANQEQSLLAQFQQSSLQIIESLLIQFPTAAYKARENRQLPAVNIIPLIEKPITRLLQEWGVEAVAEVGTELPYLPEMHQLIEGNAQPNEKVKVRYTGYRQGEKLLYRAKVSPV